MKRLSTHRLGTIRRFTEATIERLLQFKLIHDLSKHELRTDWRDVEQELHAANPIMQAGVIAMLSSDRHDLEGVYDDDHLITDEHVSPEDVVSLLGSFPFDATSCAYVFTIIEQYGDIVARIANPKFAENRCSWHRDVHAARGSGLPKDTTKLRQAFAQPFGFDSGKISNQLLLSLMLLKAERNSFAHEGQMSMSFEAFFRRAISLVCYIFLNMAPFGEILIVHHTDDLSGRFSEAEEFRKSLKRELRKLSR